MLRDFLDNPCMTLPLGKNCVYGQEKLLEEVPPVAVVLLPLFAERPLRLTAQPLCWEREARSDASLLYGLWLLCNALPEFIRLFSGKRLTSREAQLGYILAAAGPPSGRESAECLRAFDFPAGKSRTPPPSQIVYDPSRFLLGLAAW